MRKLTESQIQSSFILWCNFYLNQKLYPELDLIFSIPNGAWTKNVRVAVKLKREGLKPGVPDTFLPVARGIYHGLFIEFKRNTKSKKSDNQIEWKNKLRKQGYCVLLAISCEGAIKIIKKYLTLKTGCKYHD